MNEGALILTVQGVVFLLMLPLYHWIDPWAGRVVGWLGLVWAVAVAGLKLLELFERLRIDAWDRRWHRETARHERRVWRELREKQP